MKRTFIILLVFFAFHLSASANTNIAKDNFSKANEFFKKGNYIKAIELYKSILNNGYESSELYYNLGNCYFRRNAVPSAILYFERAKRIAPDDDDILYNLGIANLRIVDKIEPVPKFFLFQLYDNMRNSFSSASWGSFVIISLWVFFLSLAGFITFWSPLIRKILFGISVISLASAILFFVFAQQNYDKEQTRDEAIIFSPSVYVKSSPDAGGKDVLILHEGTKVKILDEVGDWRKIRLVNGNLGWALKQSMEII
ncbi:MAG: tetratricopeptide repeat protein [Bacteroidota bacterium]|jgi:tetratricopeptide (TPR) repeat protein